MITSLLKEDEKEKEWTADDVEKKKKKKNVCGTWPFKQSRNKHRTYYNPSNWTLKRGLKKKWLRHQMVVWRGWSKSFFVCACDQQLAIRIIVGRSFVRSPVCPSVRSELFFCWDVWWDVSGHHRHRGNEKSSRPHKQRHPQNNNRTTTTTTTTKKEEEVGTSSSSLRGRRRRKGPLRTMSSRERICALLAGHGRGDTWNVAHSTRGAAATTRSVIKREKRPG